MRARHRSAVVASAILVVSTLAITAAGVASASTGGAAPVAAGVAPGSFVDGLPPSVPIEVSATTEAAADRGPAPVGPVLPRALEATHLAAVASLWDEIVDCPAPDQVGGPLADLSISDSLAFYDGRRAFRGQPTWSGGTGAADGRAPTPCAVCHSGPVVGGGRDVGAGPAGPNQVPPLFGIGGLDRIADKYLGPLPDPDDRNNDGIRGSVVGEVIDDDTHRIGRYGRRARIANLREAVRGEVQRWQGIAADRGGLGDAAVERLTAFVAGLAPPPVLSRDSVRDGELVFHRCSCAGCHQPTLLDLTEIFSDGIRHDLGAGLTDARGDVADDADEARWWRTTALWGLRWRQRFLHDGRAADLVAAIDAHGGEASQARAAWKRLDPAARASLLTFLGSL